MAVLLDLDLTLVDSSLAEEHRRARRWPLVYQTIPHFTEYDGVGELLTTLVENEVPICVVTSSPEPYCLRVIQHFDWTIAATVCYHDTQQHKPHPAPIRAGLTKLGVAAQDAISVGDNPNDIAASRAAGVFAIAASWGAADRTSLLRSDPDAIAETPAALRALLIARLPQLAHLRR